MARWVSNGLAGSVRSFPPNIRPLLTFLCIPKRQRSNSPLRPPTHTRLLLHSPPDRSKSGVNRPKSDRFSLEIAPAALLRSGCDRSSVPERSIPMNIRILLILAAALGIGLGYS
ncbi:MAG: hypothetical protein WAU00_14840, partial [Caldilinea sp.]